MEKGKIFWRHGFTPNNFVLKLRLDIILWLGGLGLLDGDGPVGFNAEHIHHNTIHNRRRRTQPATLYPENEESEAYLAVKWALNHPKLFGRGSTRNGDIGLMLKIVWPEAFACIRPHLIGVAKGGRLNRGLLGWRTTQGRVRARTVHLALKDVWEDINVWWKPEGEVTNEDIFEFVEFAMVPALKKGGYYADLLIRGFGARASSGGSWKTHRAVLVGDVSREIIRRFKDRRADGTFGPSSYSYIDYLWWKNKTRAGYQTGGLGHWKGVLWDAETCKRLLIRVVQDLLPTFDIPNDFDLLTASPDLLNAIHDITSDQLKDYPVVCVGVNRRLNLSVNADGSTKTQASSHHLGHYLNHPEMWPNPVADKRVPWDMTRFGGSTYVNEQAMKRIGNRYLGPVCFHSYDRHKPTRVTTADLVDLLRYPESEYEGLGGGIMRPDHIIVNAPWFGYDLIVQMHGAVHWRESRWFSLEMTQNRDAYQWHFVWPNQEGHGLAVIPTYKYVTTVTKKLFGETITMYEDLVASGKPQWNWRLETEERDITGQAGLCNLLELQGHHLYADLFRIKRAHEDMSNDEASVVSLLMQDHSMGEAVTMMGRETINHWKEVYAWI